MTSEQIETCSFCGKHKDDVRKLIVGNSVAICDGCVNLCDGLLGDEVDSELKELKKSSINPIELKDFLDQYVIGQNSAKLMLSVAITNHYKRIQNPQKDIEIEKTNILMLGPTGTGKTLLAKTVAKYLDVPFAIADATSITEAGYVGDDVESLISRLYQAAKGDVERTERGIIFIDEIDKIARKSESASITRDVSGEGVQQALLKMVEGTKCRVPVMGGRKHPSGDMVEIDTSNILFIAGGAFVGINDIINNRVNGSSMGFNASFVGQSTTTLADTVPDDLIKFGMIPEFVGRFAGWVHLDPLELEDMVTILTDVKNSLLKQYGWLFSVDQVKLDFSAEAILALARRALDSGVGARGLHRELNRVLLPHMYNLTKYYANGITQVTIDSELVAVPTALVA
jgi:ATP-dependent Clp protease ATP-binding subunit ClpX